MYMDDSQDRDLGLLLHSDDNEEQVEEHCLQFQDNCSSCSQGHRSSLTLSTQQGGSICLVCFSNLISNPLSPTLHVSYALSQLSQALSQPQFLHSLLTLHTHFLIAPLLHSLASFDDQPIARQIIDLILLLSRADYSVHADFLLSVSNRIASGSLGWSCRQHHMLHCFGLLLNTNNVHNRDLNSHNPLEHIQDKLNLISNLVLGLQWPSEEIRGEILFILYKLSVVYTFNEEDDCDIFGSFCPKLLYLLVEALMKTQNDDVRLNCAAVLTVLIQRGLFRENYTIEPGSIVLCEGDNFKQVRDDEMQEPSLGTLFAEAIKGPLLSSNDQVQINTIDLLFYYLSSKETCTEQIEFLVEENVADYVFEMLRLSECKDVVVTSCIRVLDLLSTVGRSFKNRLVVGLSTLIPVMRHVAEVPYHSVQIQTLKLIWNCVSECPGALSIPNTEELLVILTKMLKRHSDGQIDMLSETFMMVCSFFVTLMQSPSGDGTLELSIFIIEALDHAILTCLCASEKDKNQLLHCFYLVKEAYAYTNDESSTISSKSELRRCILEVCRVQLLPWLVKTFNEMEEEIILGVLETFHFILLQDADIQSLEFAKSMMLSCWFGFSFGCLGLFNTEKMRTRVYLVLSLIVDILLGNDSGHPIRYAAQCLPSDPVDLLFLLGQKSTDNHELSSCQSAVLMIIYTGSLYDERLADEKLVLASLEQYILVHHENFQYGETNALFAKQLVNLYGLLRGLAKMSYQIPYSSEAERIIFQFINDDKWDLLSASMHPIALKWFFQQERISNSLSHQILNFCRSSAVEGADAIANRTSSQTVTVEEIAGLVSEEDCHGSRILIILLIQLIEEGGLVNDIIAILNLMTTSIDIFPVASDLLCVHGIGTAIRSLCYSATFSTSTFIPMMVLIYKILCSVNPEMLSDDDGSWVAVIMKMMDFSFTHETEDRMSQETLFLTVILSLILHHSTSKALEEVSKTILFNTYLVHATNKVTRSACMKGPALLEPDETTSTGEVLICFLLLNFFSIKSLNAILPGFLNWQTFLQETNASESFISISCQDLCRLLHFGSPFVKLITSYTLVELFTRINEQRNRREDFTCTRGSLMSVKVILEGLLVYNDHRVATNCSFCLCMLLEWEKIGDGKTRVSKNNTWCRLIVEELQMSLATPCLSSKYFINYHKPVINLTIGLLKQQNRPDWMRSVFDSSCISGILGNLSANNLTLEILVLFKELMNFKLLNNEQMSTLNRILQECRKHIYANSGQDDKATDQMRKVGTSSCDLGEVCDYLVSLMASESFSNEKPFGYLLDNQKLLEKMELIFRTSRVEDC